MGDSQYTRAAKRNSGPRRTDRVRAERAGIGRFARVVAVLGLLASAMVVQQPARAAIEEVATGQLDATAAVAPRNDRVPFVPTVSGAHAFTISWTGDAKVHANLKVTNTGVSLARVANRTGALDIAVDLTAGTDYFFGLWSSSGVAHYTITVDTPAPPPPPTGGKKLGQVALDATGAAAPATAPVMFRPALGGPFTFEVRWSGAASVNLDIYNDATGAIIDVASATQSPVQLGTSLQKGVLYRFDITAVAGAGTFALWRTSNPNTGVVEPEQPNIVVINTDDQRADSMQYLPQIRQWLGDGGRTYTDALVTTPSCCPSRASLLSGQYVHNHGVVTQRTPALDPDDTIQHYLRDAGYFTGHSGKYLHYIELNETVPHWDRWTYFKGGYNDVTMNWDGQVDTRPGYSTTITFDRAIDYVDEWSAADDDKPFYLHLTPVAPHSPLIPEAQYENAPVPPVDITPSLTETDRSDKPRYVRNRNKTYEDLAAARELRIQMLYSVDDQVARLMEYLEAEGELDNTLIIFTSDNGYMLGEHDVSGKFMPYTESVAVPFLIRWDGHIPAGSVSDSLVANIDIAPTVLAAAGVDADHAMDGQDILSEAARGHILTEYFYDERNDRGIGDWASITTPTYQYIEYYEFGTDTVTDREYYNLAADPYQLVNLYGDNDPGNDPPIAPLRSVLLAERDCAGANCP